MSTPAEPTPVSTPPKKPKRKRLWKILRWLAILILVGELALRFIFGLGNPVLYKVDDACGYLPAPNQDLIRFFARNKINAYGQRSDELPAKKDPAHFRILFIGDSMTYGTTFVDQSKTFTAILGRDLPPIIGKPVDIMNAAAGGWALFNESGYLKSRGTYDADLVIFVLNAGDLTQEFNTLKPEDSLGYPQQKPWTAIGETWSRYVVPRLFKSGGVKADAGSNPEDHPDCEHLTPKVTAELAVDHAFCTAHQAKMAVIFLGVNKASPFQVGLHILNDWAQQENVPVLDITDDLAGHSGDELFYKQHFNPKGNEAVAEAVKKHWALVAK